MMSTALRRTFTALLLTIGAALGQSGPGGQQQIESHLRQAQEFLKTNRPDLAAGEFNAILALDPDNVDARANLGVVLFFQGKYDTAAGELRRALQLRPALWNIQALLGISERRAGQTSLAKADLEKAFSQLKEEKIRVEAGMELIEIYNAEGDLEQATGVVAVLRQLQPTNPDILYVAHRIYSNLADETMLALAMSAPSSARMHQVMAQQLQRQGDTKGAIAQDREALKIDSKLAGLHFELAELLSAGPSADPKEAENEYRAALAANRFDEKSECRLGDIAFRGDDLKAAYEHYSRALSLAPDDADANLGVGKTLAAMHQPGKAEPRLVRAAQLEPFDAIIRYRLASVYRELGKADDARRELAEFQRIRDMKDRLKHIFDEMHLRPTKEDRSDPDTPK
jgi:tetratricopeptide (TPR) repeat protein